MAIIRKIPWTSHPPDGTKLSASHPLTRGLVCATLQGSSPNLVNLSKSGDLASGGTPVISGGPNGQEHETSAGFATTGANNVEAIDIGNPHTLFALVTQADNADNNQQQSLIGIETTAVNRYCGIEYRSNISTSGNRMFRFYFRLSGSSSLKALGNAGAYAIGESVAVCGVQYSTTDRRIFEQGIEAGTNTTSHSGSFQSTEYSLGQIQAGGSLGQQGASDFFRGSISMTLVYDRALSPIEVKSLSDNPWQIFEPRIQIIPVLVAAGVTATPHYPFGIPLHGPMHGPI